MSERYEVTDVILEPDGTVLITFIASDALRCEGAVAVRGTARIAPSPQYTDGIDRVRKAALSLLTDALEDWDRSPALDLDPAVPEQTLADQDEPDEELDSPEARRNWAAVEADRSE